MGTPSSSRVSHLRLFAGLSFLIMLLVACGGSPGSRAEPEARTDSTPQEGDGDTDGTPPPDPTGSVWDAAAVSHGRTALFGSFAADLVRFGDTLFAMDADQIEADGAAIRAIDISGVAPVPSARFETTTIRPEHLVDSLGGAVDAMNPIGFGFYLNDLLVISDTLGFAIVGAGGSDSIPTLSNVLAFDPSTGAVRQVFNLVRPFTVDRPLADSSGGPLPLGVTFQQSGAEGMAYVPTSATRGLLYVAMSNLIFGAPSFGAVKFPGTLQVIEVDPSRPAPLAPDATPGTEIRSILTGGYNPVSIQTIIVGPGPGPAPITRVLVTVAGTTGFDADFNLVPLTPSLIEAYDGATGDRVAQLYLGLAGLGGIRPALGRDASGHHVGFFASAVNGEVYLARLDGLHDQTVDLTKLAVLRGPSNGIAITAAQAGGPGGNVTGVALSPDGRHLVACGFGDLFAVPQVPGQLFLLRLPDDLLTGAGFGGGAFVSGSTLFGTSAGRTLGHVVLSANGGTAPEVYVTVSGTLDGNFLGATPGGIGTLQTFGLIR